MSKKDDLLKALESQILEMPEGTLREDSRLDPWDSLAVVSTIAVIDEIYGVVPSGKALMECVTVEDILKLVPQE